MAQDIADAVNYYLHIEQINKNDLAGIRHWSHLKVAFDENSIWIKDFSAIEIHSLEVKTIPYKKVYYAQHGKLFLLNSLLPDRSEPALLWTPIERALPVELPSFNHNYFGVHEKIAISLIPSNKEETAVGILVNASILQQYLSTAPAIRLQPLSWVMINQDMAFLLGQPLLPVSGKVFWSKNDFLIPAGYDFDLAILAEPLANNLNPTHEYWVVWDIDSTYFLIRKTDFRPLSLSSFRSTSQRLSSF